MSGREVITLQLGGFANFTGAHYWNVQDEILGLAQASGVQQSEVDPDVLFRIGEDVQGQPTYTPRAVIFDLKGSLGGVSLGSQWDAASTGVSTWDGQLSVHRSAAIPKSTFVEQLGYEEEWQADAAGSRESSGQHASSSSAASEAATRAEFARQLHQSARQLERRGTVRYWTDFLKVTLHPRSVLQLPGLWHGVSDFDGFGTGREALAGEEAREEARDRIRMFAEECDTLQGFQVLTEDMSGFGSVAADVLGMVRDDYPRTAVLTIPLRPDLSSAISYSNDTAGVLRARRLSECLSLAELAPPSSLYAPLAPPANLPHIQWPPGSIFHGSALCAAITDTLTLPYRLLHGTPGACDLHSLTQLLAAKGNIAATAAAFPCPEVSNEHTAAASADTRTQRPSSPSSSGRAAPFTRAETVSWTPGIRDIGWENVLAESIVLRGPRHGGQPLDRNAAASALDDALRQEGNRAIRHRCVVTQPLPIPLPFPQLFRPEVGRHGDIMRTSRGRGEDVESVPVLTRTCCSAAVGDMVSQHLALFKSLSRTGAARSLLESWGYGDGEVDEVCERLHALSNAYHNSDSEDE